MAGFVGRAFNNYQQIISTAREGANSVISSVGAAQTSSSNQQHVNSSGAGTSKNIVVDDEIYHEIVNRMDKVDNFAAEQMYYVMSQIEDICAVDYIVPETLPKLLNILDKLQSSLEEFRDLTNDANTATKNYVNRINEIDS